MTNTEKLPLDDFLKGGPGHDGYAYNADVYCVDCGQDIIRDLYESDYSALATEDGEFISDTERSPSPIFFGESDGPQHCGNCGERLYGEDEDEDETDGPVWWSSGSGRIELQMTKEQAESASHQGQCDADVKALSRVPAIAEQLAKVDADELRKELAEYGAWDETGLADHEQNLQRLLWLAACDIKEGNC
jgi:hypothetical protein